MDVNWTKFAEEGKKFKRIDTLINKFTKNKQKFVQDFHLSHPISYIFSENEEEFSEEFNSYLETRFDELIKERKQECDKNLLGKKFKAFKSELFTFLDKKDNKQYFSEIIFDKGYFLYKLFEGLSKISTKITFKMNPNNLEVYARNEPNTFLIRVLLQTYNGKYVYYNPSTLSVNSLDLIKALGCKKEDKMITKVIFKGDEIKIKMVSRTHKSTISRKMHNLEVKNEENETLKNLLTHKYSGVFSLNKEKYLHLISQSDRFSEILNLNLTKKEIIFSETNAFNQSKIKWPKSQLCKLELNTDSKKASISFKDFEKLLEFLFEEKGTLEFHLGEDKPLKVRLAFKKLEGTIGQVFIATRL